METSSSLLSDDGGRSSTSSTSSSSTGGGGGGCVSMATTPGSTSSGYWSTNDDDDDDVDDLSNDVISASLGFDPSMIGYGGGGGGCCWMMQSPYRGLDDDAQLDDGGGEDVGLGFGVDTSNPEDQGLGPEVRFRPGVDGMDLEAEAGPLETKVALGKGLSIDSDASADCFELDLTTVGTGSRAEGDCEGLVEEEPEMSLATGSTLLADFLFSDWLHGSRSTVADRMFDEFISGDVFPVDVFEEELGLGDDSRWKEKEEDLGISGSPREFDGGSLSGDLDEDRTNLSEHGIFSTEALTFDLMDPVDPFEPFSPDNSRPISPLSPLSPISPLSPLSPISPLSPLSPLHRISLDCCCYDTPEADRSCSSGCASPLDVVAVPPDFRSSCCPDSGELFDVLLCEIVHRPTPEADAGREVPAKPELVLVATPSASSKRKSSGGGDARNQPPCKTPRVDLGGCGSSAAGDREAAPRRIELPVTLVQVTSACDRPSGDDGSRHVGVTSETGKTQDSRTSLSGEFPHAGISHVYSEFTKTEHLPVKPDATENDDACAVRKAEVLAAMLQAEAVLREPNRGSDVIFAELMSRKSGEPRSARCSLVPSSPAPPSLQPRGASSLRSFLIRKQRDSSSASGQNLLHRLLKGETSEAEVRREQAAAASRQTTRKIAMAEESRL